MELTKGGKQISLLTMYGIVEYNRDMETKLEIIDLLKKSDTRFEMRVPSILKRKLDIDAKKFDIPVGTFVKYILASFLSLSTDQQSNLLKSMGKQKPESDDQEEPDKKSSKKKKKKSSKKKSYQSPESDDREKE